ncbi:dihydroneopterin aldolase [Microvirga puerhi]|uniref:7,8-dihydroneopterin aldolase n=1 Tax=Microvirga puerhi TaxID=2876078 RepID=A0ABS7VKF0_9HYPH|nr:dihydroneopterin aldolase [Microvirga puerhi]MBZ6075646.1 dihydroneopterin aldolase [Microvirga puerhi]
MSDSIILSRLAVYAYHGLHQEEAELGQRFYVTLTCQVDLRPAGEADDYGLSVCYATLAKRVNDLAVNRRFNLIEGLAEAIAADVLQAFPRIEEVVVRVEKPEAPIPLILESVAIEIRRSRHD